MATTALKGNPVNTSGELPAIGSKAPSFSLVGQDLSAVESSSFAGRSLVLNIFPSIDTGVCATSVRKFNEKAASLPGVVVLCVSKDLPFAAGRFCGAEGIKDVVMGSGFRNDAFETAYGVKLVDGALKGLMARSVVVVGADGVVKHTQLVPEITTEPDYEAALKSL